MAFKNINISELSFNPFTKIGKEWALITGGDRENYNTMTVSWGQLGVLWNKDVFTCYIRPNRYTYNYLENSETEKFDCFKIVFEIPPVLKKS